MCFAPGVAASAGSERACRWVWRRRLYFIKREGRAVDGRHSSRKAPVAGGGLLAFYLS